MKELNKPEINTHESLDDDDSLRAIRHSHQHKTEVDAGREEKQNKRKRVYLHSIGRFGNLKKSQMDSSNE